MTEPRPAPVYDPEKYGHFDKGIIEWVGNVYVYEGLPVAASGWTMAHAKIGYDGVRFCGYTLIELLAIARLHNTVIEVSKEFVEELEREY